MIPAGGRPHLITFQRIATTTDDYGQEVPGAPATVAEAFARVRFGTGQERREAAQEHAQQSATFEVNSTPTIAGVLITDRIQFDGAAWDIVNRAIVGLYREIHFSAVRAA